MHRKGETIMAEYVRLAPGTLKALRQTSPMLVSYNVEFAEVTGGTFWKSYTPEQLAGTEEFQVDLTGDIAAAYRDLMQVYPPIDLYNERLRRLAGSLGPAWARVSGSWATKTFYDFDGTTGGRVPEGYQNILTKEQWIGVLDFVKATGAKLLVSVSNCQGLHSAHEPWTPVEAEKLFRFSREYGVPIRAAEFTNEPNLMENSGLPAGSTPEDYRRDQDLFFTWLKKNYPECAAVGPCPSASNGDISFGKGSSSGHPVFQSCRCSDLMEGTRVPLDVFSYHYYNGRSERTAGFMPSTHWDASEACSEDYLKVAARFAECYAALRDRYAPGAELWVTESGDASGGGDTWASTYLDVLRTLNELAGFSRISSGVIFHNTLASSDYGFLERQTFNPRPNYFAVLLWNRLMGTTCYDTQEPIREGAHVYAHSRRDGRDGAAYLVINNNRKEATTVELPKEADVYALSGEGGNMRATTMTLNGRPLALDEKDALPDLSPARQAAGMAVVAPGGCTFFVL